MHGINTIYMGAGDPFYDGPKPGIPGPGQFIGPRLELRQAVPTGSPGQRDVSGIAAARDQESRNLGVLLRAGKDGIGPARVADAGSR